jgi:hypothetical protein
MDEIKRHLMEISKSDPAAALRQGETLSPIYERAFFRTLYGAKRRDLSRQQRAILDRQRTVDGGYPMPLRLDPTIVLTSDGQGEPASQILRALGIEETQTATTRKEGLL